MAILFLPEHVRVPPMLPDCHDVHRLDWTQQPGGEGVLHVAVDRKGDSSLVPVKSIEAARQDALRKHSIDAARRSHIQLRDYQTQCVGAIMEAWEQGTRAPLVVIATGGGKTLIAARVMELMFNRGDHRSLFIAHRKELLDQTAEKIGLTAADNLSVGIVQAKRNELHSDITIASVHTLAHSSGTRLKEVLDAGPYDVVFLDEAHHAVSNQWLKVIAAIKEHNEGVRFAGLTATPARADGIALDTVFDDVCFERNMYDLVKLGYLVPPKARRVPLDINLDKVGVDKKKGDFVRSQLSKLMNKPHVNRAIVDAWRRHGEDRKTLAFAVDIEHAAALREEFLAAGFAADHVHSQMKRERTKAFKRFRENETRILINVEIAVEGYDEPSADCILFARPTASQTLYSQSVGRGLRLFPGKTDCLILDCVGNTENHEIVQLASLAGFDPAQGAHKRGRGDGEGEGCDEDEPEVTGAEAADAYEVELGVKARAGRYQWRQTSLGWVLLIPRIGYYLVAWHSQAKQTCIVRFYDQRPGRRDSPARDVIKTPIHFDLAFGLVEGEMDRFFNARRQRAMARAETGAVFEGTAPPEFATSDKDESFPEVTFVDLEEGTEEESFVPREWMIKGAKWRSKPVTDGQRQLLRKLGTKQQSIPETAGEASDLIGILQIERDAKMRVPATPKQIAYLKVNGLDMVRTKGAAARAIWQHKKGTK